MLLLVSFLLVYIVSGELCTRPVIQLDGYSISGYGCNHETNSNKLLDSMFFTSTPQECANYCTSSIDCESFNWDFGCYDDQTCVTTPAYKCDTAGTSRVRCHLFKGKPCDVDPGPMLVSYVKKSPRSVDNPRIAPQNSVHGYELSRTNNSAYYSCSNEDDMFTINELYPTSPESCSRKCNVHSGACYGFVFDIVNRNTVPTIDGNSVNYGGGSRCFLMTRPCVLTESKDRIFFNRTGTDSYCYLNSDCESGFCSEGECTHPDKVNSVIISSINEKCNIIDKDVLYSCGKGKLVCNEWSKMCISGGKNAGENCQESNECRTGPCHKNEIGKLTCGGVSSSKNNLLRYF